MAINITDFNKIWASTSPLTPYSFTDANYQEGWNFVGATPPARQMWDSIQKSNDEKLKYLLDNFADYLPLAGGTMTGTLTLSDGGTALSDATVGTVVTDDASNISVDNTAKEIVSISLSAGTWVVTGQLGYEKIPAGRLFAGISTTTTMYADSDGTSVFYSNTANNWTFGLNIAKILVLNATTTVYLLGYVNGGPITATKGTITAVRIK